MRKAATMCPLVGTPQYATCPGTKAVLALLSGAIDQAGRRTPRRRRTDASPLRAWTEADPNEFTILIGFRPKHGTHAVVVEAARTQSKVRREKLFN